MLESTNIQQELNQKSLELKCKNLEELLELVKRKSLSHKNSDCDFILSCCYTAKKQSVLAFKYAKQALELDLQNTRYWIRYFECSLELKNISIEDQIIQLAMNSSSEEIKSLAIQFKKKQAPQLPRHKYETIHFEKYFSLSVRDAIDQLNHLLTQQPLNASILNAIGSLHLKNGDMVEASQHLQKAVHNNPLLASPYNNLGVLYKKQQKVKLARENFHASVFLAPRNLQYANNLANLEYSNKNYSEACSALEHLLTLGERNFNYFALAYSHQMQGNFNEALSYYQKWLSKYPEDASTLGNIGVIYLCRGEMDSAIRNLQKSVDFAPSSLTILNSLGAAYLRAGNLKAAQNILEKAIRLEQRFIPAHTNLGLLRKAQGRSQEAIKTFEKALELDPTSVDTRYNFAVTLHDIGELQKSVKELQKVLTLEPNHTKAMLTMGNNYLKLNSPKIATKYLENYLKLEPMSTPALNNLGNAFQDLGDTKKAIEHYEKAIQINPCDMPAYRHLGLIKPLSNENGIIRFLERQKSNADLNSVQKIHLHFTLTNAYEGIENFDAAFESLTIGNKLAKNVSRYSSNSDRINFAKLKKQAEKISKLKTCDALAGDNVYPIFIFGMPRSGTTLVDRIISNHKDVTSLGELRYARMLGWPLSLGTLEVTNDSISKFRSKYSKSVEFHQINTKYFIDKMPHNFQMLPLLSKSFPNAHFLHVKRDRAATCWSNYRNYFTGSALAYSACLDDIIEHYDLYEDLMALYINTLNIKCTFIDYEKLVANPRPEIALLLNNLNLPWDASCLTPEKNTSVVQTASQNQVRRKIYQGSSKNWMHYSKHLAQYAMFKVR